MGDRLGGLLFEVSPGKNRESYLKNNLKQKGLEVWFKW
jgi:hypothetical protein